MNHFHSTFPSPGICDRDGNVKWKCFIKLSVMQRDRDLPWWAK